MHGRGPAHRRRITDGLPCTTHTDGKEKLARRGGTVIDARVVDDGDLLTAAGITSGLEARGTVWTP